MVPEFQVKKGLLGGHTVSYQCPQCSAGLKARLDEAGTSDSCPDCGAAHTVPGTAERNRIAQAAADAKREKQQQVERARREKESREASEQARQQAQAQRSLSEIPFEEGGDDAQPGNWIATLVLDKRASVSDQVAAKMDVGAWFATLTKRMKGIAKDLAFGCSTSEVAEKHGVTAGRISQLRRTLEESWGQFQGVAVA
jgi:uncharacterized Zn finger protein (UPF0148 family)